MCLGQFFQSFVCPSTSIRLLTMDILTVCNSVVGGSNISVGNIFFLKNKFGGYIFIEKLVPGGTNFFWGGRQICHDKPSVSC